MTTTSNEQPRRTVYDVRDLAFSYERRSVLTGLSFDVPEGDFLCIAGPNGAGKSTLLRLLAGMRSPGRGQVRFEGAEVHAIDARERARRIALVPQNENMVFANPVRKMVLLGRFPWLGITGIESERDSAIAGRAMELAGIAHLAARPVTELSGGEQHRVVLARALAQDTPVLLLDEPTAHLDLRHQVDVFTLLAQLHAEGRTVLCVTHELNLAAMHARRIMLLGGGGIAALGTPDEVLTEDNLRALFDVDVRVAPDPETGSPHLSLRRSRPR
jgi:iron complex transport system ATP-binding protein